MKLTHSERLQFLGTTLASMPDGVVVVNAEGCSVLMNEAGRRLVQRAPLPGVPLQQQEIDAKLCYPDGREVTWEETPLGRALRGQTVVDCLLILNRVDGSDTYISASANPVRDEHEGIIGAVCIFRDVTERQRAEGERQRLLNAADAQRSLLQSIFENVPAGIAILSGSDFVYELVNPAYQAIAPGKQMVGRTVAEVWPEIAHQQLPILERVWRTGEPCHMIDACAIISQSPDTAPEQRYFSFACVPLCRPEEGNDPIILLLAMETTEQVCARKQAGELAIVAQRRAAELQSIIDNMVDGVFVCDLDGRVTLANESGVKMLGLTTLDEVGRGLAEYVDLLRIRHPDGQPVSAGELPLVRALAGEVVSADEVIYNLRTKADMIVRANAAPIRDEKGRVAGAVEVARDITELTEFDRLKDQFISVAAHELKTPIAGIKGYAQLLLKRECGGVSDDGLKALQAINRQTDRIGALISDLLDISRLQLGQLELAVERVNLSDLAREAVEHVALVTTKHHVRVVAEQGVVVQGDRGRLEAALSDLLDNAIKYSPHGGDIDVAVAAVDREAVISVRDHGVGIPRDKQALMFERFYRPHTGTPYDFGGIGVGLFITREIISRHGGRTWFESQEGKGSTFFFGLPLGEGQRVDRP